MGRGPPGASAGMARSWRRCATWGGALPSLARDLMAPGPHLGARRRPGFLRRAMLRRAGAAWRNRGRGPVGRSRRGASGRVSERPTGSTTSTPPGPTARPPRPGWPRRLSGIPFSFSGRAHDLYPPDGALTGEDGGRGTLSAPIPVPISGTWRSSVPPWPESGERL